jgi:hypothetical protein
MHSYHAEGAGLHAGQAPITGVSSQHDSTGDAVTSQRPRWAGGQTWSLATQVAYLGIVQAQGFILDHAQSGGRDAEATLVPGDAGDLAGATSRTQVISNAYTSGGHRSAGSTGFRSATFCTR